MQERSSLPQERLLRLFINGRFFTHILCTPVSLKELTMGWLFTQRYIDGLDDVGSLGACEGDTEISVSLKRGVPTQPAKYNPVSTSGCSGGEVDASQYFQALKRLESTLTVSMTCLRDVMSAMFRRLASNGDMSGMHCASLASGDNFADLLTAFDVGRHNAVDKVIGAGLLKSVDFSSGILATSGRISSDMVLKAARAGVPVVVSQRSVTTLAADLAGSAGVAIVGRINRRDRVVLGQTNRIRD
jgi:FdhD protein